MRFIPNSVRAFTLAACALVIQAAAAHADVRKFTYQVRHSSYGNLGTYTNTVDRNGPNVTVATEGHISVGMFGLAFYRQDFSRLEHWQNGRLVAFHGTTKVNGRENEVSGMAEGDHFVVSSPNGTFTAPANVRIANPWSGEVIRGDTLITPDRGLVENVRISVDMDDPVTVGGKSIPARRVEVDRLN